MALGDLYGGAYEAVVGNENQRLKVQQEQALIANTQAQLGGYQGRSMSDLAKGQLDTAILPNEITSKNADLEAKTSTSKAESLSSAGTKLGQIGTFMESIPSVDTPAGNSRVIALKQIAAKYNIPEDFPILQEILKTNPNDLPKALKTLGTNLAMNAGDFQQKRAIEQDKTQALIANADTSAEARKYAADKGLEGRLATAEAAAQRATAHANIEQKIAAITSDPGWKSDPAKVSQYTTLMKSASVLRNAAANGYQNAELLGQDTPGARADSVINDVVGDTGKPSASSDEASAKQAFGSYEPDKYEYGINPKTGNFARRPK